jgi:hypothetical protein
MTSDPKRWLAPALAVACLAAHAEHAHKPPVARADLGASAVVDPDGRIWAAYKEGAHVMVRSSADDGASWDAARAANAVGEEIEASGDSRPTLAVGPKGEVYVAWTRPLAKFHTGEIRFARSTDGGRTFSAPVTVHRDRRPITHRFGALAVTPEGQLYVAWIDSRDGPTALYFSVSDDRGATFREERRAALGTCECCRIALLAEKGGVLALWRHVFEGGIRDHAVARLAEGAPTLVRRATFDDWRVDACPHHGPSLARDASGGLHAVWFTLAPGKEGVRYGRLAEGRMENERLVGGPTAAHADLAANGDSLLVAWKEQQDGRTRLMAMRSADAGRTWKQGEVASTEGASDQPKVLVRDGAFRILWNTREKPLRVISPAGLE